MTHIQAGALSSDRVHDLAWVIWSFQVWLGLRTKTYLVRVRKWLCSGLKYPVLSPQTTGKCWGVLWKKYPDLLLQKWLEKFPMFPDLSVETGGKRYQTASVKNLSSWYDTFETDIQGNLWFVETDAAKMLFWQLLQYIEKKKKFKISSLPQALKWLQDQLKRIF